MLHSVLVHSGGVHGGHYYAFIRPTLSDQWYKFDDERVTKEDVKMALEEQYGGEEELPQTNPGYNNTPFKFTKYSNAYTLVYIRVSDKDKIICNVDEKDIAKHLRIRLKKEQEEKEDKRRYKAQAHLYTIIKVALDEDLKEQIGKYIFFDLVDHDKVRNFRIQKQLPFNLFKEEVAKEFGIPVQFQRFWIWAKRPNHTSRPNRPLTPQEEAQTVGALREASNKAHNAELKLFLEVERGQDLQLVPPPDKNKEDIMLFFKFYDPHKEELRYVGRLFVKMSGKPIEILTKLNELAGFALDQEIELFEEINFEPSVMCERLDKRATFRFSQIEDGDIICFQKRTPPESEEQFRFADVPSFLEYVKNRQIVHFRALERPKEDGFCLELAKNHTYDDVVERVAQHLGLDDPSKIWLTHNCYSQQPKPNPLKYRSVDDHLLDMLVHYNQISDILYYEVLDIPLPELQRLRTLKVTFHHATKDEAVILNIRLPKPSTFGDVLNEIKTKFFPIHEKIENVNDQYWTLRAEEIPEEEKNLGPNDQLIHVYHFTKESTQNQVQVQNFGEPFFLVIHEGETLAEVKLRVQKKLQVPDEEFAKWKFAFLSLGRTEYLEDSEIVSNRFQRRGAYGAWEQYLGLEHSDTTPKRAYSAFCKSAMDLSSFANCFEDPTVPAALPSRPIKNMTSATVTPKKTTEIEATDHPENNEQGCIEISEDTSPHITKRPIAPSPLAPHNKKLRQHRKPRKVEVDLNETSLPPPCLSESLSNIALAEERNMLLTKNRRQLEAYLTAYNQKAILVLEALARKPTRDEEQAAIIEHLTKELKIWEKECQETKEQLELTKAEKQEAISSVTELKDQLNQEKARHSSEIASLQQQIQQKEGIAQARGRIEGLRMFRDHFLASEVGKGFLLNFCDNLLDFCFKSRMYFNGVMRLCAKYCRYGFDTAVKQAETGGYKGTFTSGEALATDPKYIEYQGDINETEDFAWWEQPMANAKKDFEETPLNILESLLDTNHTSSSTSPPS